jgi:hypothetical protein
MDFVKPVVQRLRRLAATGDGCEHQVGRGIAGRVRRFEFRPGEQVGAVHCGLAFEGRNQDDVPLQPLGLVYGEEFDKGGSSGDGIGFGEEFLQAALQEGWIKQIGGSIFVQYNLQLIQ